MKITIQCSKKILIASIISILAFGPAGVVTPAKAAMVPGGAVGPVNPTTGFPVWYMDQDGLALELMEAADGFGISAAVEPGNAFSQQIGFGPEGFWWSTEGTLGGPGQPVDGLMVLALEAAFAGETAINGEQSVFGRSRFTIDVPAPGTYTVEYPYGTKTFVVDAIGAGPEIKNEGSDIGCFATLGVLSCDPNTPAGNPNNFSLALQSEIGPFLTWDTFNIDPALTDPALVNPAMPGKRYVGNPLVEHKIKGSPVSQNHLRITGPSGVDLDASLPGIQTTLENDLFTVTGRVAVIDTVAPAINATAKTVPQGSNNIVLSANITDDIGVRTAKIDLGSLGNVLTTAINNSQEVPPTGSTGSGSGTFSIDTDANALAYNINATGLTGGPVTHMHIHAGAPGANGPMLFDLGNSLPANGVWNYPEDLEDDILSGSTYIQIHTLLFDNELNQAGGEIRGQILPQSNIANMVLVTLPTTNGIWSVIAPSANRLGTFNLPITATDGSQTAHGTLTFIVNRLESAAIAASSTTIISTSSEQFSPVLLDNNNSAFVGATTVWTSSDNAIATVNQSGLVTGVTPGTAIITLTASSGAIVKTATTSVTVLSALPVLSDLEISPSPAIATVNAVTPSGTLLQMSAAPKDQFGNPFLGASVIWSSDNAAVATIDAAGLVTTVATGTAMITAIAADGVATATRVVALNVVAGPTLATINIAPSTSTIGIGATRQLSRVTLDQHGAAIAATLDWISSDPAIATVSPSGLVTGLGAGTATITARNGAIISNSSEIIVEAPVLASINVTPANQTVAVGSTLQLVAAGFDQFSANMALVGSTTWQSSNPAVATVNSAGLVNAIAAGTVTVSATNGSTTGSTIVATFVPASSGGGGGGGGGGAGLSLVQPTMASPVIATTAKPAVEVPKSPQTVSQVMGVKLFKDGSLLKAPNNKLYYIVAGKKFHVRSLQELQVFVGRPNTKVSQESLDQYPEFELAKQAKAYKDGLLLRDKDTKKIFLVKGQKVVYVANLAELRKLGKRTTVNVDVMTLMQYVRF